MVFLWFTFTNEGVPVNLQAAWKLCGDNACKCTLACGAGTKEECRMWQQQRCPSCARITGYKCRKAACKLALAAPTEAPLLEIEAPPTVVVATFT